MDDVLYGGQVSISNSGEYIAAGTGHKLFVFKKDSNIPFREFDLGGTNPRLKIREIALSSDGSTVVASSGSRIHMFDVNEEVKIWSYNMINYGAERISISYDGNFIAVAGVPTLVLSKTDYESKILGLLIALMVHLRNQS